MKKETTVILAAMGAIPMSALAQDATVQTQAALALNDRTISIVQSMLSNDALYANNDGTELRIRSSAVDAETLGGLSQSAQVKIDDESGDYVVDQKFAAALAGSRILSSKAPKSVADVLLMMNLEKELKSGSGLELASFMSAPFF